MLTQLGGDVINKWLILLDTCLTASVIYNMSLVSNISHCNANETLEILKNGGSQNFKNKGIFNLFNMKIHINEHSMVNTLSLKDVASIPGARLTMDTFKERAIKVQLADGKC